MPEKRKGGSPAVEITPLMRYQTKTLAGMGLTQADVAIVLKISEPTLQRRLAEDFQAGLKECDNEIVQNLKRIAKDTSGKHPGPTVTAAIFYSKVKLGYTETQRIVHGFDPSVVMEFVSRVIAAVKKLVTTCPHCKTALGLAKPLAAELLAMSQKLASGLAPHDMVPIGAGDPVPAPAEQEAAG